MAPKARPRRYAGNKQNHRNPREDWAASQFGRWSVHRAVPAVREAAPNGGLCRHAYSFTAMLRAAFDRTGFALSYALKQAYTVAISRRRSRDLEAPGSRRNEPQRKPVQKAERELRTLVAGAYVEQQRRASAASFRSAAREPASALALVWGADETAQWGLVPIPHRAPAVFDDAPAGGIPVTEDTRRVAATLARAYKAEVVRKILVQTLQIRRTRGDDEVLNERLAIPPKGMEENTAEVLLASFLHVLGENVFQVPRADGAAVERAGSDDLPTLEALVRAHVVVMLIAVLDRFSANRKMFAMVAALFASLGVPTFYASCCLHKVGNVSSKTVDAFAGLGSALYSLGKVMRIGPKQIQWVSYLESYVQERIRVLPGAPPPRHADYTADMLQLLSQSWMRESDLLGGDHQSAYDEICCAVRELLQIFNSARVHKGRLLSYLGANVLYIPENIAGERSEIDSLKFQ